MPNAYLGSTAVSKVYLGATSVTKVYLGNTQIWVTGGGSLSAVGMNKSGTQSTSPGGVYFQITGWTNRSGWGSPTGNTLVASANGVAYLAGSINIGTGFLEKSIRVKQNGNIIWETPKAFITSPLTFKVHAQAVAGDVFTVEAYCNISTEFVQTDSYMTMKEEVFALTPTHSDDFNRANGDLQSTSPWENVGSTSATRAQVFSNQVRGQGANNTRSYYSTSPNGATSGTYFKIDIIGIGTRVGLSFAAQSNSGRPMSFAALTNSTTMIFAEHSSTVSSNLGTTNSTLTIPTFTAPGELLAIRTSDVTASIFLKRVFIGTYRFSVGSTGTCGGLYTLETTDVVDNYEQGTWAE